MPEVIQRSYVCARDPKEDSRHSILQDSRRSFLFPERLFPERVRHDGTPFNVMLALARGSEHEEDKPLDKELVERAHKRRRTTSSDQKP